MSHAINSHVLTGKNSWLIRQFTCGWCTAFVVYIYARVLGRHKTDVINSNVQRNERNLVTLLLLGWRKYLLWSRSFQNMFLCAIKVMQKWTIRSLFPKFSRDKMTLCNNNDQTWFSDTFHIWWTPRVVQTLAFQAWVSTSPSGSSRCKCIEKHVWSLYSSTIRRQ